MLRGDEPPLLAIAFGFFHTIEVFWGRRFSVKLKNSLRAETGRLVWDEPVIIDGTPIGWMLKVNQPTKHAIKILDKMWKPGMSICRLHIAYDLDLAPGVTRAHIRALMMHHTRMKYTRLTDKAFLKENTIYFVDFTLRDGGRISASGLYYDDEPSDLDGEDQKPHLEIRLLLGQTIKRQGIYRPRDLLKLNPREFLKKRIVMKDHVGKIIRDVENAFTPHPLVNVERRICGMMVRSGKATLSDYRRDCPRKYEKLPELSVIDVQETLEWAAAKGREREKEWGKLCILSQANVQRPPRHRERLIVRERL
jgi:hypothetical protein